MAGQTVLCVAQRYRARLAHSAETSPESLHCTHSLRGVLFGLQRISHFHSDFMSLNGLCPHQSLHLERFIHLTSLCVFMSFDLQQGSSTSALFTWGWVTFVRGGSGARVEGLKDGQGWYVCAVPCRRLSSKPGLFPICASSIPSPP